MTERRYTEDEVAEIFRRATETAVRARGQAPTGEGMTLAQMALRWCLDWEAVSVVIPGAKNPDQALGNAVASDLPPLGPELHERLGQFYAADVAPFIRGPY